MHGVLVGKKGVREAIRLKNISAIIGLKDDVPTLRGRSFLMGNRCPECFLRGLKKSCPKIEGC